MQTFLPQISFKESAACLDNKRLGKQRVETMQIMKALLLPEYGWKNHPAVKMWKGYEFALLMYQRAICEEWSSRGFKDTCWLKTKTIYEQYCPLPNDENKLPPWYFDEDLRLSHRSNLVRKDASYYSKQWPDVKDNLPYIWPKP